MTENNEQKGFSWGTGITIAIIIFITATLSMVAYLVSLDYEMVAENHYEKAVNYQEHIDRVEQTSQLEQPVEINYKKGAGKIEIKFPGSLQQQNLEGTITLYRPDDSSMDRQLALSLDKNGLQYISTAKLQGGKWSVKINWSGKENQYFSEQQLFL